MFVVMVITNYYFAKYGVKMPIYVVVVTCLLVLYLGLARSISKVKGV